jgi:glyoxylase-like metal-dependent hydrolase (beta-lactamase superfamily II)
MRLNRFNFDRLLTDCVAPILAMLVGCSGQSVAAQDVVDQSIKAMGGRAAVLAANSLVIEGNGQVFLLGQNRTPDAIETNRFRADPVVRRIDLAHGRWRQEQTLTPEFAGGASSAPQRDITALDGDVAFDVDSDGRATRAGPSDARSRRAELHHVPLALLRAALEPRTIRTGLGSIGGRPAFELRTAEGDGYTVAIDPASRLPVLISSIVDHPNLGDVAMETELADYRPVAGLMLPMQITVRLDRRTLTTLRVSKYTVGGAIGDLTAPAAVRSAPATPAAPEVTVDELAPGVWLLAGQSHHSVAIELADHLILIEAPVDDARTLAVIERARRLRPGKPLTQVVVTHHHVDHAGGLRAAVSEGLAIVAHEKLEPFARSTVARSFTLAPDALARRPRPLHLEPVGDQAALGDATRAVDLYQVTSAHADPMLVVHLPRERLLIEADLYTAPRAGQAPSYDFAAPLFALLHSKKLAVDRLVPLHRGVVRFTDLPAGPTYR